MKRATIRELHLRTGAIVRAVAEGESYVIEKFGVPVAELRPFEQLPFTRRLPDRERLISKMPRVKDSGRILKRIVLETLYFGRLTLRSAISTKPMVARFGSWPPEPVA